MNKRGTWVWADTLYWFFYLPMTAIVIIALVVIPKSAMEAPISPGPLDAAIMEERLLQAATLNDPVFGSRQGYYGSLPAAIRSEKRFGFRVEAQGKESFFNKAFYEQASPLAPINYDRFIKSEKMREGSSVVEVEIDQVYPKEYG